MSDNNNIDIHYVMKGAAIPWQFDKQTLRSQVLIVVETTNQ